MFFLQLFTGAVIIVVTVAIHATILDKLLLYLEAMGPGIYKKFRSHWKVPMMIAAFLGAFMSHILQIWLWAGFYLWIQAFDALEEALYFSTVTFTTVGYGDIVLPHQWRLLSSFEGANGILLIGWSTAYIFEIMSKLYERETIRRYGEEP